MYPHGHIGQWTYGNLSKRYKKRNGYFARGISRKGDGISSSYSRKPACDGAGPASQSAHGEFVRIQISVERHARKGDARAAQNGISLFRWLAPPFHEFRKLRAGRSHRGRAR